MVAEKIKIKGLTPLQIQILASHLEYVSNTQGELRKNNWVFYYSFCRKFAREFVKKWVGMTSDKCTITLNMHDAFTLKEVLAFYSPGNSPLKMILFIRIIEEIDKHTV